jgi:hypothetical protein
MSLFSDSSKKSPRVAQPYDWRAEPRLIAAQEKLAAIEAERAEALERIRNQHDPLIAARQVEVERAEMEVLAGAGSEAALAAAQQRHLDARSSRARDVIAAERLEHEAAKLRERIDTLRLAAKNAALADLRARYRKAVQRLMDVEGQRVDAAAVLDAVFAEAADQFASADLLHQPGSDSDGYPVTARLLRMSEVENHYPHEAGYAPGPHAPRSPEGRASQRLLQLSLMARYADEEDAREAAAKKAKGGQR